VNHDDRSNGEIWEDRADRAAKSAAKAGTSFTRHPVAWIVGVVVLLGAATLLSTALHDGGQYVHEAHKNTQMPHVREQTDAILRDWEDMKQAAATACNAKDAASDADSPTLVEDPVLAYKSTYRNLKADYDRRMENFFEAALSRKVPLPYGIHALPRRAPSLASAMAAARKSGDC
jgi:hypothetical protein